MFMNVAATIRLLDYHNYRRYILSPFLDLGMILYIYIYI